MSSSQVEKNLSEFRRNVMVMEASGLSPLFGDAHFPSFLGRTLAMMTGQTADEDARLSAFLSEFPTETTLGERKLLYNFFQNFWEGTRDVLEVGPFLGGTSRAIALGMLNSPNRQGDVKLYTYDRFRDYYAPQRLLESLAPLFQAGKLDPGVKEAILGRSSFLEVFQMLHGTHEYGRLIQAATGILPDYRDQALDPEELFTLPADRDYSAVFVDGAKSWYGTKDFMVKASRHTAKGAYYLFQDYGAHTCYWVPVYLELMKDHYRLVAHVDHTYVYQQMGDVTPALIQEVFPDTPQEIGVAGFRRIFRDLLAGAMTRDNTYTLLNYQLQHAAALATLGELDQARDRIVDLLKSPHALTHKHWILNALRVPTYTPEGDINLY